MCSDVSSIYWVGRPDPNFLSLVGLVFAYKQETIISKALFKSPPWDFRGHRSPCVICLLLVCLWGGLRLEAFLGVHSSFVVRLLVERPLLLVPISFVPWCVVQWRPHGVNFNCKWTYGSFLAPISEGACGLGASTFFAAFVHFRQLRALTSDAAFVDFVEVESPLLIPFVSTWRVHF